MNVLLVNPEYPPNFFTYEKLLKKSGYRANLPPLGLLTLAALLPRPWRLTLRDLAFQTISPADWAKADVVMVGGMAIQAPGLIRTIREAKAQGRLVVVGGPLAFHCADKLLELGADIVLPGEAEGLSERLIEAVKARATGLLLRDVGYPDLALSPLPRYDLIRVRDYASLCVQFSRGCPFHCDFCDITLRLGHRVRTKSPDQILAELDQLHALGFRRQVIIADDNFIGAPERTAALLERILSWQEKRGHPIQFCTQVSLNLTQEPELLELLVRAGFFQVFIGLESPHPESLRACGKSHNLPFDQVEACRQINERGLIVVPAFIMGLDHEPPGLDRRVLDFVAQARTPEVFISLLHAIPGTVLWDRLQDQGRLLWGNGVSDFLDPGLPWWGQAGGQASPLNVRTLRPNEEITAEYVRAYQELYQPGSYLERAFQAVAAMRPGVKLPPPPGLLWGEARAFLWVLWRQGVASPSRGRFWSRLAQAVLSLDLRHLYLFYFLICLGEHHRTLKDYLAAQLAPQARPIPPEGPDQP